jgi:DNA (cytosine-5)-methyltransferase 1
MASSSKYRIVDLFAGCGGISRGFQRTGRFGTEFAVELVGHAANTFAANITTHDGRPTPVYAGDIEELTKSPSGLVPSLARAGFSDPAEIDVLVGGPPCQGFSRNGVRIYEDEERTQRFYDTPRNHLYKAYLDFVAALSPKLILIENVREFLKFGGGKFTADLLSKLDELGYEAGFRKLCAADFGVPQMRHRVFFVAKRKDLSGMVEALFPEPGFGTGGDQLTILGPSSYLTVREAIADLPSPASSHSGSPQPYEAFRPASAYAGTLRSKSGMVHNHVARQLKPKQIERIRSVGTGRMRDIAPELRTRKFYGSAYRRLDWDAPALTITTWVYHVGSGAFAHPEQDRGITMREAARLQSFDDDFVFPKLINPVSQMIGNAVPPLLAQAFADRFAEMLDGNTPVPRGRQPAKRIALSLR